ncbi:MAG: signal peptidase I [Streptosporangiales bacterium]|nr:signal peptidase I [Streptosporangiales bacterium]
MAETIQTGNAETDTADTRGWLLGHFRPGGDARHSDDVEVKWAIHPRGEERAEWVEGETRSALVLLVSGRFRIELPGRVVVLAEQGDYVVFHRTGHSWHAEEDSVVVVIRWPSVPGYAAGQDRLA